METTPRSDPHSGLGIASTVFAGSAGALLATSLKMLLKASFLKSSEPAALTAKGAASLTSMLGAAAAATMLLIGLGLGIAAILQHGRKLTFAITGTVINASLLLTLFALSGLGYAALKESRNISAAPMPIAAAVAMPMPAAAAAPQAGIAAEIARLTTAAVQAGYESVLAADLASDPARYESHKVALSGFFSGSQLESFTIYGKWASGGTVVVNGSKLLPAEKKKLLLSLDGFHKVFVRGVYKPSGLPNRKPVASLGIFFQQPSSHRLFADEIVDLGRVDPLADNAKP